MAKVSDHAFLDMELGSKMSSLGLSILAKNNKPKTTNSAVPNNEMLMRSAQVPDDDYVQMAAWGASR